MGFALSPRAKAAGYRLQALDTIDSTNAEAMRLGRAGEGGPLWVVSRHQSAGRGRRGRAWATPRGNLAATLLLTLDLPPVLTATLGFVAGLALG
jgi:BirA family transcriptional regulator, biotin operon repressor / biotin---[acetyl-CoA-carboxylase] ligase